MLNKSVTALDIRSSQVTCVVAERGVNNTFIIKSKYDCDYDGYAEGEFIDRASLKEAITSVLSDTITAQNKTVKNLYVGVPGEFIKTVCTDRVISFNSTKRIRSSDVDYITKISRPDGDAVYENCDNGCIYYVLSDKRRTVDPVGEVSDALQAKLCFYLVKRSFMQAVEAAVVGLGLKTKIKYIPSVQSEATYLIAPETRDKIAVIFDWGYISSSFSVVCGNGVLFSDSFSVGVGHLAYLLSSELDLPYEVAYAFLQKVNLNAKDASNGNEEYNYNDKLYKVSSSALREKLRYGLDWVCEVLEECFNGFTGNLSSKTLFITGEGVNIIRGACEHISSRTVRQVEELAPNLPYYNKPQLSSLFSLMNSALNDAEKTSFFKRIFS